MLLPARDPKRQVRSFNTSHGVVTLKIRLATFSPLLLTCVLLGDESGPVSERSRVTAFVNTENGIEVECWEIGDLLPQSRSDGVRALSLNAPDDVTLYSFAPSTTIFDLGSMSASSNDFRKGPK